ncbi:MAG TPA: AraC family ligand binding domain-containing protein [Candidatus Limnocylindria bacterium]|nr:AraC family ligand binding domain-containing protein [Candidatus Limnocylindria bacterium]
MTGAELPGPLRPLPDAGKPTSGVAAAVERLRALGTEPSTWSNAPGDRYAAHEHGYTKLLVCAAGSITFLVGQDEVPVGLHPGDGFELPPGTRHGAVVGPQGCTCVEGHRR